MLLLFKDNINEKKINVFFYKTSVLNINLSPNRRGGEHIVFGSDPAGTGVTVSCVHDIIIMSQLAKFNQIWMDKHWDMMKSLLGFCDLDLIFKVTAGLKLLNVSQKVLVWPKSACVQDIS